MDIRELRIGSSVLFNDERVKVIGIADFKDLYPTLDSGVAIQSQIAKNGITFNVNPKDLSPIPITEELLKELGFEYTSGKRAKCFNIIDNFEKSIGGLNRIKLVTGDIDDIEDCFDLRITTNEQDLYIEGIRYLHELENFVYLSTKKELI